MRRLCCMLALTACTPSARDPETYRTVTLSADTLEIHSMVKRVAALGGFRQPESAQYDSAQDVFFVSNMQGAGSAKDGNGYIVRVRASDLDRVELFAAGGQRGVTLDAPKGMAISGDTLWVADIDVVRGFDRRTGAPRAEYDLRPQGARLLNAIAVGPDGTLYVTDSGITMTDKGIRYPRGDRVFALRSGTIRTLAAGPELRLPNGIDWDERGNRLVVASFHPLKSEVYALDAGGARTVLATGPGRFDGLQVLPDGRILTTSWNDHSLHLIDGESHERIATHLVQPADIGLDTRRNRVLVPLVLYGQVEVWQL